MQQRVKEEHAVVLDFLPNGYALDSRPMYMKTAIAQAIGKEHFILLELVPKKGVFLQPYEEVYMGEGKRDKVHHIVGRIAFDKLTQTSKLNVEEFAEKVVENNEKRFVEFFNKADPINTRRHQIELLPGVGKKHMWEIIEERKEKPFESFSDVKARVKLMPDPKKAITKRLIMEIRGDDKYHIFVSP